MKKHKTGWGHVAKWYHGMLEREGTYQKEVILPNLLRRLTLKRGDRLLDVGCGEGFFTRAFWQAGANVVGVDVAKPLIALAQKNMPQGARDPRHHLEYVVSPAHHLPFLATGSVDVVTMILTLQNIENAREVLRECARVLKLRGRIVLVVNHPMFRVPRESSWGWDEKEKTQYRRIDRYLSEFTVPIQMHPGGRPQERTLSFHRPLQWYVRTLGENRCAVTHLEEWISHKETKAGPRASGENRARNEIPMFLFLEARKED